MYIMSLDVASTVTVTHITWQDGVHVFMPLTSELALNEGCVNMSFVAIVLTEQFNCKMCLSLSPVLLSHGLDVTTS